MATQPISPIAETAPIRTPDRRKHSAAGREKFVVPGAADAPRKAQEPRRDAAGGSETGVAEIRSPDDRRNALRRAEGERTAPAVTGESGGTTPPHEAAGSGSGPTEAAGATAAPAALADETAQATVAAEAAHAALADKAAHPVLTDEPAHTAPPHQAGVPSSQSSADNGIIEDLAAGVTAGPASAATKADGGQAAGQPGSQGMAETAPDDIPAGQKNPATAPPSASPASGVSDAAGAASIPAAAAVATMDGTARETDAFDGDGNPDAGPSDARNPKAAGTGSAAAGAAPAPSASANGSGTPAGGNAPGAANAPSAAATSSAGQSAGQSASQSAARIVAGAPPAAADAMQPAAAAPPPGDGTVAPSFQAEMRAALDAPAQAAAATARGAVTAQPAADQVALQISRAVEQGSDRLTVHLKPAELGKVTIELEVGPDRRVTAVISAERSETLDLLQRDARSLERALNDAGLRTGAGSLEFGLQGNGDQAMQRDGGNDRTDGTMAVPGAGNGEPGGEAAAMYGPRIVPDGRVNIQV